jgi:hypothetical protein
MRYRTSVADPKKYFLDSDQKNFYTDSDSTQVVKKI